MSLEQEIKLTKPITPEERSVINIILTGNYMTSALSEVLSEFDITIQQYNVLRILRGAYPECYNNGELLDRMMFKNTDLTRLVDRLRQKSLVERKQCKEDKRRVEIGITGQGLELLGDIDGQKERIETLVSRLTENECKELNRLLEKVRE